jgi:hypothetical protein
MSQSFSEPAHTHLLDSIKNEYAMFGNNGSRSIVGLSKNQIEEYIRFQNAVVNKHKTNGGPYCGSAYWREVHQYDRKNMYQIKFFIPNFSQVKNSGFDVPAVYFADTIVKKSIN